MLLLCPDIQFQKRTSHTFHDVFFCAYLLQFTIVRSGCRMFIKCFALEPDLFWCPLLSKVMMDVTAIVPLCILNLHSLLGVVFKAVHTAALTTKHACCPAQARAIEIQESMEQAWTLEVSDVKVIEEKKIFKFMLSC